MLVDHDRIGEGEHLGWQGGVRRCVDDDPDATTGRERACAGHRLERDLELGEQHVSGAGGLHDREGFVTDPAVGAGRDHDGVLTGVVDDDEGGAGGLVGEYDDPVGVDAERAQPFDVGATGVVVPDRAEHQHVGAGCGGRHGLVGALAAGEPFEPLAEDGLPGQGMPVDVRDQVDVERPEHQDATHHEVLLTVSSQSRE